jgi:hypothetical protein
VDLSEDRYSDYTLGDKMQNLSRIVWVWGPLSHVWIMLGEQPEGNYSCW